MNIPVSHRGHGDDGPVQGGGHGVKHRPLLVLLPHVGEAAEYQHAHDDDQHEEPELFITEYKNHQFLVLIVPSVGTYSSVSCPESAAL